MGVILPEEDSELLGVLPVKDTSINHDAKDVNSYDRVVKQLAGLQMENKKLEQYKALLDAQKTDETRLAPYALDKVANQIDIQNVDTNTAVKNRLLKQ